MPIKQIFRNNEAWVIEQLENNPEYFNKLAQGQSPKYLYIGCSDSRVPAETLMGLEPGEVFVHRNIANLAPNNDLNSLSVINYAVNHLKVTDIIVCGHYNCGGIKAAMQTNDYGLLNPWLQNIRDVYRLHRQELDKIESEEERYVKLIELNVREQCINIAKTPDVQQAFIDRKLHVHGWVFDIKTGRLVDLKMSFSEMDEELEDIYGLFEDSD